MCQVITKLTACCESLGHQPEADTGYNDTVQATLTGPEYSLGSLALPVCILYLVFPSVSLSMETLFAMTWLMKRLNEYVHNLVTGVPRFSRPQCVCFGEVGGVGEHYASTLVNLFSCHVISYHALCIILMDIEYMALCRFNDNGRC